MNTTFRTSTSQLLLGLAAAIAIAAAHAGTVTISTVPLATSSGANILPNLLFTLDASGSMASDYLPDYSNDTQKCMSTSSASTTCSYGDAPYRTGGSNGFNGVAYDPNVNYAPGLDSTGKAVLNWSPATPVTTSATGLTLPTTTLVPDAYLGGSTINITTGISDRRYCNSAGACKRNGADTTAANLVSGSDYLGNTMSAGRFPYRTHGSNASTLVFGLPEMMRIGSFVRSATNTTVTTIAAHGLAVNDVLYVTGTGTVDGNAITVVTVPSTTTFTYATTGSNSTKTGSFRKHSSGSFVRTVTSGLVTVTATAHGMATNDVVTLNSVNNAAFVDATRTITVLDANTFTYVSSTGTTAIAATAGTWVRSGLYNVGSNVNGAPVAYQITPVEYCTDANLTNCQFVAPGATPPSGYNFAAYVRFCQTQDQALSAGGIGDASGTPRCRSKYVNSGAVATTWIWPRYGFFNRDTIQSTVTTYANRPGRTDCASAPTCSYTEEIQNYARWYTYYRTRIQMMKTAAGRAFVPFVSNPSAATPIPDKLRVGFITINPFYDSSDNLQSTVQSYGYLKINNFNTTQAASWFDKFYKQSPQESTPLRTALSRAGWIFAGKLNTALTNGIPLADDPMQASCQRNYTLLTTDGYWNGTDGYDLGNTIMGNIDNVDGLVVSPYTQTMVDRAGTVSFDGGVGTVVTTQTPTRVVEQNVCYGSANTTFGGGTQTGCGCSGTQQRLWTRTQTTTQTLSTTDGVQTANTTTGPVTTFAATTACQAAFTSTVTTTGNTITEEQIVVGSNNSTFPLYGTPTGGANPAGTCAAGQGRVVRRITTVDSSTTTTNGVAGAPTYVGGTTSYAFVNVSACSTVTTQQISSVAEVAQYIVPGLGSSPGTVQASAFPAPGNSPPQTNPQSNFQCRSGRNMRVQRDLTYNKTITTVGTGAPVTTYSANTSGPTYSTVVSCTSSSVGSVSSSSTPTLTSNTTTLANSATAAGTTNGAGTAGAATTSGTALAVSQSPNPSSPTVGTATVTPTYGGYPNTLADVAMYYYRTDLRGGTDQFGNTTGPSLNLGGTGTVDVSPNNIPVKAGVKDFATHQHMVTFTVGMADGFLRYSPTYDTDTAGDFPNIKAGAAAGTCFWTSTVCNWPQPFADDASALDDLWHAGVNGRGNFYSALNVSALVTGISNTLNSVNAQVASAAASATSSPNVTQTDNQIFSTTYETITWAGKVFAQTIDPATGNVLPTIQWQADTLLLTKVAPTTDTRSIYTLDLSVGNTNKIKTFVWANLTGTQQGFLTNKCVPSTTMTQCSGLTTAQAVIANDGTSLLGFLRGQSSNEGTVFRDRTYLDTSGNVIETVLGDTITAKPAYVRGSINNYTDSGYAAFVTTNSTRSPRVYVGANDGYLHAFNALTGDETWAYTPSFLMPGLYQLADTGYPTAHRYYVDGSPESADVYDTSAAAWKTILVAGTGGGFAGFYAVDITNPSAPKGLWEFCNDPTLCAVSDTDLGLAYGNPVIGKRSYDGRWVVILTSGLNNTTGSNPGVGYFYVLDAITGAKLDKVAISAGTPTTPAGLMKMSAYYDNAISDATFRYVYAGDQLGNIWRLDMNAAPTAPAPVVSPAPAPVVLHIASLKDGSSPPRAQPITTRPALTHIGTSRILYVGTGRFLGAPDLTDPGAASGISWQQSLYAFKDKDADYGTASFRATTPTPTANLLQQTLSITALAATSRTLATNATTMDWTTKDGWFIDFNPTFGGVGDSPGEGVNLVDPKLVLGTLVVTTNAPAQGSSSCSVGGSSYAYNFDFKTGLAVSTAAGGVVGSSLGGTITVGVAIVQLPSGAIKTINTGADTSKTTDNVNTSASGAAVKRFSYRTR